MPEQEQTETVEETTDATATDGAQEETETDWKAEAEKWKAMSRKTEQQAKANAEAAKRLAEIEEANKTAEQKAAEEVEKLRKENETLRLEKLRSDIASEKSVPASLLSGSDEDSIRAAADALLAFKGTTPAAPSANGQGRAGTSVSQGDMSPEEVVKKALSR